MEIIFIRKIEFFLIRDLSEFMLIYDHLCLLIINLHVIYSHVPFIIMMRIIFLLIIFSFVKNAAANILLNSSKCGKPGQSWFNNDLIPIFPSKLGFNENETVTYSCRDRLYVDDADRDHRIIKGASTTKKYMRFRQSDGTWSGSVPKCGQ